VKIEVLSRFRTAKEQKAALVRLGLGEIDIIIGTHRLLSPDVTFKDLGLLVVDEEHRFGVKHKERLKALRLAVDVLTLTATPIPRTLHLSLAGLRDLTLIETPPRDRSPIQTVVEPWDDGLLEEAMARELDRGGQVFFVHNRVETIETIAARVRHLAPRARVGVAHGQMASTPLEDVMQQFVAGEIDILVSTMIVESGLDVPNANTMIVHDAHRFGLAQLYQLRGRVGRSHRRAYWNGSRCWNITPISAPATGWRSRTWSCAVRATCWGRNSRARRTPSGSTCTCGGSRKRCRRSGGKEAAKPSRPPRWCSTGRPTCPTPLWATTTPSWTSTADWRERSRLMRLMGFARNFGNASVRFPGKPRR
jgi:hypothetical protein